MEELKPNKYKKSLGQNFIFDKNLLAAIARDAGLSPCDTVLEIGAGAGTLTAQLAKSAKQVVVVEIDRDLKPVLENNLSGFNNISLVFDDILKLDYSTINRLTGGGEFKVVANLPYYITTPVIFYFLESPLNIKSLTVMVQKEVAERIVAPPGGKTYGALTLSVRARADAVITRIVGRNMFTPSPDVDSAVVRLDIKRPFNPFLSKVVRGLFLMRRKTVLNNLCAAFSLKKEDAAALLDSAGISPESRAEQLSFDKVQTLSNCLAGRFTKTDKQP